MAAENITQVYILAQVGKDSHVPPVKIGITGNLETRINTINTSSPLQVSHFASVDCFSREVAREVEAAVHNALCHSRLNGEWFSVTPYDALAAVCSAYRDLVEARYSPYVAQGTLEFSGVLTHERRYTKWIALNKPSVVLQ